MKKIWGVNVNHSLSEEESDLIFDNCEPLIADALALLERWDFRCNLIELMIHEGKFIIRTHPKPEELSYFRTRRIPPGFISSKAEYEELECCYVCRECGRIRLETVGDCNSWQYKGPPMPVQKIHCNECKTSEILEM